MWDLGVTSYPQKSLVWQSLDYLFFFFFFFFFFANRFLLVRFAKILIQVDKNVTGKTFIFFLKRKKKETLWPFFMDGVKLYQGYRATTKRQFTFTIKSLGVPHTHLVTWSASEGWKAGLTFEPPSSSKPENSGFRIQCPNH